MVRSDLPLAHQAVQAAHAGIASARELIPPNLIHPSLVLCTVPSEAELLALRETCFAQGVPVRLFVETDMGEQITALATGPVSKEKRKIFRCLPLFKGV